MFFLHLFLGCLFSTKAPAARTGYSVRCGWASPPAPPARPAPAPPARGRGRGTWRGVPGPSLGFLVKKTSWTWKILEAMSGNCTIFENSSHLSNFMLNTQLFELWTICGNARGILGGCEKKPLKIWSFERSFGPPAQLRNHSDTKSCGSGCRSIHWSSIPNSSWKLPGHEDFHGLNHVLISKANKR